VLALTAGGQAGRRRWRGHTLLELLAVLSISALLLSLGLPALTELLARQRLRATASDLFSAIELTRVQAMARGRRVLLMPAGDGADWRKGWLVFVDRNNNLAYDGGEELLLRQAPLAAGITVRFGFTSGTAAPQYIAYNSAGRSCSASNSLAARWGTLSLIFGKQERHIKINMLGRVRICDPQQSSNCSGAGEG